MANAKLFTKYQDMIIKLHLQGVTDPSEILGALLRSYTLSNPTKAQKLSALFQKRRLLDEIKTLLETQALDFNNLKPFIVTFDKVLSQAKWNTEGDLYALWVAFFSHYPGYFDPRNKRIPTNESSVEPRQDSRRISELRACWMTAEHIRKVKIQGLIDQIIRTPFKVVEESLNSFDSLWKNLSQITPYFTKEQRMAFLDKILATTSIFPTGDLMEFIGKLIIELPPLEKAEYLEKYQQLPQKFKPYIGILFPYIAKNLSQEDKNRFITHIFHENDLQSLRRILQVYFDSKNTDYFQNLFQEQNPEGRTLFHRGIQESLLTVLEDLTPINYENAGKKFATNCIVYLMRNSASLSESDKARALAIFEKISSFKINPLDIVALTASLEINDSPEKRSTIHLFNIGEDITKFSRIEDFYIDSLPFLAKYLSETQIDGCVKKLGLLKHKALFIPYLNKEKREALIQQFLNPIAPHIPDAKEIAMFYPVLSTEQKTAFMRKLIDYSNTLTGLDKDNCIYEIAKSLPTLSTNRNSSQFRDLIDHLVSCLVDNKPTHTDPIMRALLYRDVHLNGIINLFPYLAPQDLYPVIDKIQAVVNSKDYQGIQQNKALKGVDPNIVKEIINQLRETAKLHPSQSEMIGSLLRQFLAATNDPKGESPGYELACEVAIQEIHNRPSTEALAFQKLREASVPNDVIVTHILGSRR